MTTGGNRLLTSQQTSWRCILQRVKSQAHEWFCSQNILEKAKL